MGCFSKSENHWTKRNTMRVLVVLLLCAFVMIGVATVETIRTMNTLAIIALCLALIGAVHLILDIIVLTYSSLNRIYIAILYSILIVCWISISGVEFVEIGGLSKPEGAFKLKLESNNWVGCHVGNMTYNRVGGEPYVTHCTLPVVRFSFSWAMVGLYIAASIYVTREKEMSLKIFGRSKVQGEDVVEGPIADPPAGGYSGRVMRVVIREQDGEISETSLDQDYPNGDLEKVFVQHVKD